MRRSLWILTTTEATLRDAQGCHTPPLQLTTLHNRMTQIMGKQRSVGAGDTSFRTGCGGYAISALLMGWLVMWWALPANAATAITISTTLDTGVCTSSLSSSTLTLGTDGKIDPASALGQSWTFLGQANLSVTVSCSAGLLSQTATPALRITPQSGTTESSHVPGLFASTTTGFGVVIGNKPAESLQASQRVTASAPYVNLKTAGTRPEAIYTLPVAIACGDISDCAPAGLKAGAVSATFIVNFEYH